MLNVGKETVASFEFCLVAAKVNELLSFVDRVLDNNLLSAVSLSETTRP